MHVAIVAPDFPPELGGMQTYALEVARELARRGAAVTVFTSERHRGVGYGEPFEVLPVLHCRLYRDLPIFLRYQRQVSIWHVMTAAYAWVAQHLHPAVVSIHGNDFLNPPPIAAWDLPRRWKLPFGSRWDDSWGRNRTVKLLRSAFSDVDHTFSNSRYTESRFLELHPRCQGKTSVSYVGLGDSFFNFHSRMSRAGDVPHLVTVCRLSERRKNIDRVLQALGSLPSHFAFHYTVVGEGCHREQYQLLAQQLGLSDRVTFAGRLSDEQLKSTLAGADLFVLTSSANPISIEGFGIAYLEANSLGAPVLAARIAGAIDAVDDGVSGFFVDVPTVEQIRSALCRFLSRQTIFDPEACRAHARKFRWSSVVDHMLGVYRQLGVAADSRR